ncbi:MAG: hypothetical protein ACKOYP_10835, partial [Bacteroidota bacterium]
MNQSRLSFLLLTLCASLFFACKQEPAPQSANDRFSTFIEGFGPSSGRGRRPPMDNLSDSSYRASLSVVKEQ